MRSEGSVEYDMAHNVKFLADGFCAVVWGYIGDLDYFTQFFGFPDTQGAEPCGLCPCTNQEGDVPWSDFRSSPHPAVWMTRLFKHADFIARGRFTPLLQLPGVTCFTLMIDWMHVKYLGTDQYFLGSVLALMTMHIMSGIQLLSTVAPFIMYHRIAPYIR